MKDFRGKLAVITGGGTGIGRELALQLVAAGAHIAICDVFDDSLADAKAACEAVAGSGARVSAHRCDVADEAQVLAFRDAVLREHATDHVELLFNNAAIAVAVSFVKDKRATWERTFNVCWFGVYYCTRAFLPLLIASSEACLINTSSINGVFAIDRTGPHTAYCSAKFAVIGFSESLITDLRVNAPHVSIVLVMPGHIGTSIVENTLRSLGIKQPRDMNLDSFRDDAPLSAAQAAAQILDAVRTGKWRLLIGEDAKFLDREAREHPDELYDPAFLEQLSLRVPRKA